VTVRPEEERREQGEVARLQQARAQLLDKLNEACTRLGHLASPHVAYARELDQSFAAVRTQAQLFARLARQVGESPERMLLLLKECLEASEFFRFEPAARYRLEQRLSKWALDSYRRAD